MSTPPSDPPEQNPEAPHRGMIPRDELPFLPKVKWRFWIPIVALLIAFPTYWLSMRAKETRDRRARLLHEHQVLTASLGPEYLAGRERLERWIIESVGPWQGDLRDPAFTYEALTREPVLYARTRLGEIRERNEIMASVRHRYPDQLLACLGAEVTWLREVFDKGSFLLPSYVDTVRGSDTPERLAALRTDLRGRILQDTELIVTGLRRRYFMLAVDEARLSIDGPTRVYVFDLREQKPVLRARGTGEGLLLIPFQISGLPRAPAQRGSSRPVTVSQHDCSVANSVRTALGVPVMGLSHAPDPPAAPASSDGGTPDAATASTTDATSAQTDR